jgi:hypothetical protein
VAVRERVSPWRTLRRSARRGWAQLYRWVLDVRGLFRLSRPVPESEILMTWRLPSAASASK